MNARAIVLQTHAASLAGSDDDKKRAHEAAVALGDQSNPERADVYNAFLNLLYRGAPPTEGNILSESKKLRKASEQFAAEQRAKHQPAEVAA